MNASRNSSGDEPGAPDAGLSAFMRISQLLLDSQQLPLGPAREFMQIVLRATPSRYAPGDFYEGPGASPPIDPPPFDVLQSVFEQLSGADEPELLERFLAITAADVTLNTLVRNILTVWYNGYLGTDMAGAEAYAAALVWPAIGANPPGLPGPYYGHWAYPPERPVVDPHDDDARLHQHSVHSDARPRR